MTISAVNEAKLDSIQDTVRKSMTMRLERKRSDMAVEVSDLDVGNVSPARAKDCLSITKPIYFSDESDADYMAVNKKNSGEENKNQKA